MGYVNIWNNVDGKLKLAKQKPMLKDTFNEMKLYNIVKINKCSKFYIINVTCLKVHKIRDNCLKYNKSSNSIFNNKLLS